ncbi:DUF3808 domain-containing protein [Candidatus Woesearchaeota archaeon]|nr:DUF3808 domain-containing protein [Candidatus Woesearchaeota archaeon]
MKENKYKTRDEWKKLLLTLSEQEFQDLSYDILKKNSFQNVRPRGKGGDGGRDIQAEFVQKIGKETLTQKFWFQCKRYDITPLNFKAFSTEVVRAQDDGIDRFVVMSNKDMTSDTKTEIEKWNNRNKCQISDWTGTLFIDMLWELQNVCKTYFPDEKIPPLVDVKEPISAIYQSENVGKRFGVELQIQTKKEVNLNNPQEVADIIKDALVNLNQIDINIKSLLYQKISLFFFSFDRIDDALMLLNKSLEITPKNIEALLNKGFILERINELEESNECYDEILTIEPNNKYALNNKAHNLHRQGELEEALEIITIALEKDKDFIISVKNKINILKALDRADEALNFLKEKEELLKKSNDLRQTEIDLCIYLIDLKKAYELNEQILNENSNEINAINNKGVIFEKNSNYQYKEKYLELAFQCFDEVVKKDKTFVLGWSNKTAVLLYKNIEEASKIIDLAYTSFSKSSYILNEKGKILLMNNRFKEALDYFEKALKYQQYYDEKFLINKASAFIELGRYKEVLQIAERILHFNPKSSAAWHIKAQASHFLHEPTKARIFTQRAEQYIKKPISLLEGENEFKSK